MKKRVVITGIAPLSINGIGKNEFMDNIYDMKSAIEKTPSRYENTYKLKSRYYLPPPMVNLSDYGLSVKRERIIEQGARYSLLATKMALEDANYKIESNGKYKYEIDNLNNCCIILGTGFTNIEQACTSYNAHDGVFSENQSYKFNRFLIPSIMPNSISAWLSIVYGINGYNYTINASCASGTYAVGNAFEKVQNGEVDVAISGGIEYLKDGSGATMRGFDTLGTLTTSDDGYPRPFSRERSGFLFCEGAACILILEELEHALKRNADIYAEIIDYKANSDANNIVRIQPSGKNIKKMVKNLIEDKKIDYINTHGTGTLLNDKVEAKIIKDIFGSKMEQPYLNSTKGIVGHSIGASGALEIAVTAYSIKNRKIHGNILGEPMDDLNILEESIDLDINYALSTSYGFGGHNAGIVLKKMC